MNTASILFIMIPHEEGLLMKSHKQMTLEDRQSIAAGLNASCSFKAISHVIHKDCTTVSREVRQNHTIVRSGCWGHGYNNCAYSFTCYKSNICQECKNRRYIRKCRLCSLCNDNCSTYKPAVCRDLRHPPYVCNGCAKRAARCTLEKHIYDAVKAHTRHLRILSEARTGISMTEEEIHQMDLLISPLLKQGQSIHHIYENHKDELMVSESTIYKLVDAGLFSARNLDLPRKVRFAPRKKKKEFKVEKTCRIGRDYKDFLSFIEKNPDLPITQMDTVEGVKGGKVILTVHFVRSECMIAFLRDRNDARSVTDAFNSLYEKLPPDMFCFLMPVLLGDNGSEFSNPSALETGPDGRHRTRVFYCDASAPYQKGSAERNHEFIRFFVPKGKPFDPYCQADINLMMDHINSYGRPSLGNRSPYDMMAFLYGENVCSLLGLKRIPPDKVTLNKSIFSRTEDPVHET